MDVQVLLTVAGASAELVGLALVVFDVRDARRSARAAHVTFAPDEPMTFPVGRSFQVRYDTEGERPPLEERIDALEREVADQHTDYLARIDALQGQLREEAFERIRKAMLEAEERERRLREFVADQLDSGIGRRIGGTALFVVGVFLSAGANLAG
jgi:hypothetical protein